MHQGQTRLLAKQGWCRHCSRGVFERVIGTTHCLHIASVLIYTLRVEKGVVF